MQHNIPRKLKRRSEEALKELMSLNATAKHAYLDVRDRAWTEYIAWRQSQEGKKWYQQKLEDCKHTCPECGADFHEEKITVDHKHPRSYYPWLAWDKSNLWLLCSTCNTTKSNKKWDEYLQAVQLYRGKTAVNRILKQAPSATGE